MANFVIYERQWTKMVELTLQGDGLRDWLDTGRAVRVDFLRSIREFDILLYGAGTSNQGELLDIITSEMVEAELTH